MEKLDAELTLTVHTQKISTEKPFKVQVQEDCKVFKPEGLEKLLNEEKDNVLYRKR